MSHPPRPPARLAACGALLAAAALGAGCGKTEYGSVSGRVTVNGKPVRSGLITFQSEVGNKDVYSAAIRDGEYQTDEIPVGPAKVAVVPALTPSRPGEPPPESAAGDLRPAPRRADRKGDGIADRYQNLDTSGLVFEVRRGANTFSPDLKP
jgi:hypothetical protein